MNILFVNACVRTGSRTLVLAKELLKEMQGEITEVTLHSEGVEPLTAALLEERERLIASAEWEAPIFRYARQFANADEIVIAAPFWDLSFPAILKIYLERITVPGITFHYRAGNPIGLCKAQRLTYVTTAGGPITEDHGYSYIRSLAKTFYGIQKTRAIRAEKLDVYGISAENLLREAEIRTVE